MLRYATTPEMQEQMLAAVEGIAQGQAACDPRNLIASGPDVLGEFLNAGEGWRS